MSASWAKVGAKCVCVAPGRGGPTLLPTEKAVVGQVYTIRAVVEGRGNARGCLGLLFEEIHNPISPVFGVEYGYYLDRFRPLITQEDDVRLIKSLLLEDAGLVPAGVELVP